MFVSIIMVWSVRGKSLTINPDQSGSVRISPDQSGSVRIGSDQSGSVRLRKDERNQFLSEPTFRGSKNDDGVTETDDAPSPKKPTWEDMLIVHATVPGQVSYRSVHACSHVVAGLPDFFR
jgi:hypothetical protein